MQAHMYPHEATLWRKTGEESRQAVYERINVPRCRVEPLDGSTRTIVGDAYGDGMVIVMPDCGALPCKGDLVSMGASEAATPPLDALRVKRVDRMSLAAKELGFLEVTCGASSR